MSSFTPATSRSALTRGAAAAVTGALALGLAAVPAAASAASGAPSGAARIAPVPKAEIAVKSGVTKITVSAETVAQLRAKGILLTRLDARGNLGAKVDAEQTLDFGVKSGAVSNVKGKVGGRLAFKTAGMAMVNLRNQRIARLTAFQADLTTGTMRANLDRRTPIELGTFSRPAVNTAVNTKAREVNVQGGLVLGAKAAVQLNKALHTKAFVPGVPLFDANSRITLDEKADPRAVHELGREAAPSKAVQAPQHAVR
ncbi:hypothetical protein AB0I49_17125 [Streptomyces sp. NPDC050617]|uniref:hypothetical protein n=1 Tax=Streptomyces sp. NPDC050617 TaxID=3154628 RepID=UPI00343BFAB3